MPSRGRHGALVFVGGSAGTGVRYLLSAAFPFDGALPVTLGINVSGAFLLGALTAFVAARFDGEKAKSVSALLGTGFLGGYTTYGMFAVDTDGLLLGDQFWSSLGYGLATVVLGFVAAGLGFGAVAAGRRSSPAERTR
jgi:CrcB protein